MSESDKWLRNRSIDELMDLESRFVAAARSPDISDLDGIREYLQKIRIQIRHYAIRHLEWMDRLDEQKIFPGAGDDDG